MKEAGKTRQLHWLTFHSLLDKGPAREQVMAQCKIDQGMLHRPNGAQPAGGDTEVTILELAAYQLTMSGLYY